ncbi:MAG TPA: 2-oxoglutarate dehydrogenase complex dihydrolipoyllysine-residue succinyltransferase [Thermomicrobiales bacterium]|nr:2-oxoglutarate dehydrogenase complex dihydrolipoyllysine-residue succinyltransferase [Thermomicrobiales bacterium]
MPTEIRVPQLGESIVEATVGQWLKGEGDAVAAGEPLVELETNKVNLEVNAPEDGVLAAISRHEGDTVGIGDVLGVVGDGAPAPSRVLGTAAAGAPTAQPAQPAPAPPSAAAAPPPSAAPEPEEAADSGRVTPLARRIAAEHGVDLAAVPGTGPGGRVTKDDIAAYVDHQHAASAAQPAQPAQTSPAVTAPPAPAAPPAQAPPPRPAAPAAPAGPTPSAAGRPEERVRMSRRRLTIARRLVEAQQTAAMLTTFNEVDMSAVMDVRKRRRDAFKERHNIGLGFMSFFTKACVGALKAFPRVNAEIQGEEFVVKRYYDIGIAVGVEEGLVVPVVRDADRLSFAAIEQRIADLAKQARENKLSLADLQGGTFTITNGGVYGSLLSTPILNAPQVGILGMHKIEERPVVVNHEVVVRPMMYLALSYDHRIVDGSEAVRFLVRVKELIEDPEALLLEG